MVIFFAILISASSAQAAFQTIAVQQKVVLAKPKVEPRWNTKIETKYAGSSITPGYEGNSSNLSVLATTGFKVNDRMVLRAVYGFNQIINPRNEFSLTNPEFRMFYRLLGDKKGWSVRVGPTAALPLSVASQDQSLYFAVGGAVRLAYNDQNDDGVGFVIYYDVGYNRNNHQYETSNAGESNTMSSIDHLVAAEYSFDKAPITLGAWIGFSSAWTYVGVVSNNYTVGQEVAFSASDNVDLALGHERGGDFLSPSGQSYNFGLFDAQESRFYLSATLKI